MLKFLFYNDRCTCFYVYQMAKIIHITEDVNVHHMNYQISSITVDCEKGLLFIHVGCFQFTHPLFLKH